MLESTVLVAVTLGPFLTSQAARLEASRTLQVQPLPAFASCSQVIRHGEGPLSLQLRSMVIAAEAQTAPSTHTWLKTLCLSTQEVR